MKEQLIKYVEERLIEYETATLAKDKGFNQYTEFKYKVLSDNCAHLLKEENSSFGEPAPTQALLQKWLRENHNIEVDVCPGWDNGKRIYECLIHQGFKDKFIELSIKGGGSGSHELIYEEALEKGLNEALKLIK